MRGRQLACLGAAVALAVGAAEARGDGGPPAGSSPGVQRRWGFNFGSKTALSAGNSGGFVEVEVVWKLGRWRVGGALGGWGMPPAGERPARAQFDAEFLRLFGGRNFGGVEVVGGPVVAYSQIEGDVDQQAVLFGGGLSGRVPVVHAGSFKLVAGVSIEAYANQVVVRFFNEETFHTPRVVGLAFVGLAIDSGDW